MPFSRRTYPTSPESEDVEVDDFLPLIGENFDFTTPKVSQPAVQAITTTPQPPTPHPKLQQEAANLSLSNVNLFQQTNISQLQRQDPLYAPLIEYLENGTLTSDRTQADLLLRTQQNFFLYDNVLYHVWVKSGKGQRLGRSHVQLVIPTPWFH